MSMHLRRVGVRFGRTTILEGVSFDVPGGSITGFLGHNGSGKTTSMRAILGLLPGSTGQFAVDGFDGRLAAREARARIGALIEHCAFYPGWNGHKNLVALGLLQGLSVAEARKQATDHIEAVGLTHASARAVRTYSQGMRQRLGIAQALLGEPSNLILDEPTNGLDPEGIAEMIALLEHLARDRGMAILYSSHQLHELAGMTDRVVVLKKGHIIAEGTTQELLGDPRGRYRVESPEPEKLQVALEQQGLHPSPVAGGRGYELESVGREPSEILAGLVQQGIPIEAFAPRSVSLVDFYLHADERSAPESTPIAPAPSPEQARAPKHPIWRVLRFERMRLAGVLPWLLLPAGAAAIRVVAQAKGLARETQQVEGATLFSATDVTAYSAVLRALETGLPLLFLFSAGLASQSLAGEFGRGTLRNIVQRGLNRSSIAFGKLLAQWACVLVGYAILLGVAILSARQYFAFGDLTELLPNGQRFPILTAADVWPEYRNALLAPILPLIAFSSLGFAIGALLRSGASALATTLGAILCLDLLRGLVGGVSSQAWLLGSYLPTPLGDRSEVHAARLFAEGATNAIFDFDSSKLWLPMVWVLGAFLLSQTIFRFRRVP
ncbi:MAG TPA: ATP-binding cassette domain-containing protein [Planctomycetota bacterium]|nr:ATP-binding cassette domain-containing protein [Planctomycetota bacterium]